MLSKTCLQAIKDPVILDKFLPRSGSSRGLRQVQSGILRDLDGLVHCSQQTLSSLSPQGGAEALGTSDQQLHHHVGIFLHALTYSQKGVHINLSCILTIHITYKRNGQWAGAQLLLEVLKKLNNVFALFLATQQHLGSLSWQCFFNPQHILISFLSS